MIAYGVGQEIARLRGIMELDDLLRAAKIGTRFIANQFAFGNEVASQITRNLEQGHRSQGHVSANAHTYTRFEVGVQFVTLNHIEGNGAMSQRHLTRLGIDASGISLETRHA